MTGTLLPLCLFQRKVIFPIVVIIEMFSLINVGLIIITKIITDRISKYPFAHNFIKI